MLQVQNSKESEIFSVTQSAFLHKKTFQLYQLASKPKYFHVSGFLNN